MPNNYNYIFLSTALLLWFALPLAKAQTQDSIKHIAIEIELREKPATHADIVQPTAYSQPQTITSASIKLRKRPNDHFNRRQKTWSELTAPAQIPAQMQVANDQHIDLSQRHLNPLKPRIRPDQPNGHSSLTDVQNKPTVTTTNKCMNNTVNCVWVGAILIIIGIAFGLLFGRAVFLISAFGLLLMVVGIFFF